MAKAGEPPMAHNARLLRLAAGASVLTACILILAKLGAWLLTGSVSVLASLVDSLMDAGASLVNLFAIRYSLAPPDAEHRFGHGKAEALAGLAQATFIAGSAVFLILQGVERLRHPVPLADLGIGMGVMGFAVAATIALLTLQRHVIRRTGSTAIRADALHYATDLATGASVILALLLTRYFGWSGIDSGFAIVLAVYILFSAWRIAADAWQVLMDRELPEDQRARIEALARAAAGVRGVHDLRTRQAGQLTVIQLHLELDGAQPLRDAHAIAKTVEAAIGAAFPGADITIHEDPVDAPAPP